MSKVIVAAEYVSGEQNSTGYYWSRLIERLSRDFDHVIVLSPAANQLPIERPSLVAVRLWPARPRRGFVGRALVQVLLSLTLFVALLRYGRRGDVVVAGTNPALQVPFIAVLRGLLGLHWVHVAFDAFPLNLEATGLVTKRNPLFGLLKAIYAASYRAADRIVVIGRDMAEVIVDLGVGRDRVAVIPNWAPISALPATSGKDARASLGWSNKIIVQFFGNIGRAQGIPELLAAIAHVKNDAVRFLFAGDGAMSSQVDEYCRSHPNARYLGPIPMRENQRVLEMADICIVALAAGMKGLGVPSKTYFNLAADKFIIYIGEPGSEIWQLLMDNPVLGWNFTPGDTDRLVEFLNQLVATQLNRDPGARRRFIQENCAEEAMLDRYVAVIRQTVS